MQSRLCRAGASPPARLEEISIRKKGKFETSRVPKNPENTVCPEWPAQQVPDLGEETAVIPDVPVQQTPALDEETAAIPAAPVQQEPAEEKGAPPAKKKSVSPLGKLGIVLGSVVLAAALAVCAYGFYLMSTDTVFANVYVAGVNVGGLNRAAAIAQVEGLISTDNEDDTLTVVLPDRKLALTPDITNAALDPEGAIDAAMRYGRDGGPLRAIRLYYAAENTEHTVDLESSLNLDTEAIRTVLEQTAAEVSQERTDPVVTVDEAAQTISVLCGGPEIRLDTDGLYNAVIARFHQNNLSDLSFDYETVPCEAVDLQTYYDKYCTDMVDAYYDEETHELVKEENGYGFDLEEYAQKIAMAKPGTEIVIRMQDMIPELTLEELQKTYFATALASYDSPHVVNSNRTNNLTLACKAINGTVLNPGEEFSFNDTVGERTQAKGYLSAIVYQVGGTSEPELGGGICQVASAIYECCLYANMEVTERTEHMFAVTYVDPGQDATVYWNQLDFAFKNTSGYPVRIDASVSDGYVHIKLMGTEEEHDYDHIKITYETYSVKDWATVGVLSKDSTETIAVTVKDSTATDADGNTYKVVDTLDTAYTGKSVTTYRHFMDKDNKELSSEKIATSVYEKRDKKLLLEKIVTEPEASADYDENGNYIGDPAVIPGTQSTDTNALPIPTEWQN